MTGGIGLPCASSPRVSSLLLYVEPAKTASQATSLPSRMREVRVSSGPSFSARAGGLLLGAVRGAGEDRDPGDVLAVEDAGGQGELEPLVLHRAEVLEPGLGDTERRRQHPGEQLVGGALEEVAPLDADPVVEEPRVEAQLPLPGAFRLEVRETEPAELHRAGGGPGHRGGCGR